MKIKVVVVIAALIIALFLPLPNGFANDDNSIYNAKILWKNDRAEDFELSQLKGEDVILTMAYTRCKTACPLTFKRLKEIEARTLSRGKKAAFVVVSFDQAHDTPKELEAFRVHNKLTGDHWHLLNGSEENIRKLSVLLGISYQLDKKTNEYMHSNKIVLLNRDGAVKASLEGLASDVSVLVEKFE